MASIYDKNYFYIFKQGNYNLFLDKIELKETPLYLQFTIGGLVIWDLKFFINKSNLSDYLFSNKELAFIPVSEIKYNTIKIISDKPFFINFRTKNNPSCTLLSSMCLPINYFVPSFPKEKIISNSKRIIRYANGKFLMNNKGIFNFFLKKLPIELVRFIDDYLPDFVLTNSRSVYEKVSNFMIYRIHNIIISDGMIENNFYQRI